MNIRWMRTGQIKGGHMLEAIGWSKEISAWASKKHNVNVETWLDTSGQTGTIRWTVEHADMASFDKAMTAVMADPEYWRFVEKAIKSELFFDGVSNDIVLKKI